MNNGYGKFGQKEFPTTKYINEQLVEEHIRNPLLKNIKRMND